MITNYKSFLAFFMRSCSLLAAATLLTVSPVSADDIPSILVVFFYVIVSTSIYILGKINEKTDFTKVILLLLIIEDIAGLIACIFAATINHPFAGGFVFLITILSNALRIDF